MVTKIAMLVGNGTYCEERSGETNEQALFINTGVLVGR